MIIIYNLLLVELYTLHNTRWFLSSVMSRRDSSQVLQVQKMMTFVSDYLSDITGVTHSSGFVLCKQLLQPLPTRNHQEQV